jgi:hypothetical protein
VVFDGVPGAGRSFTMRGVFAVGDNMLVAVIANFPCDQDNLIPSVGFRDLSRRFDG